MGFLLWLVLLPVVGAGRLCWRLLRVVVWLRPRTLLVLGGLAVALSTPNALTAQLTQGEVGPLGHMIAFFAAVGLTAVVFFHGLRSPWLRGTRRRLMRAGKRPAGLRSQAGVLDEIGSEESLFDRP